MKGRKLFSMRSLALGAIVAMLVTILGATALVAAPEDSSVSAPDVPLASGIDNTSRTTDLVVTSTSNVSIVSATVALGTKTEGCNVTATASVSRTVDGTGFYVFSVGLDSTTSTLSSERRIEFVSTTDADVVDEIAATSQGYDSLTGTHTFNFLVRKSSGVDTTVTNATILVECNTKQL
jgi:hypothetical protein